ncbi:hydantoinase [Paenibacillus antibioticophila]|uniref:Hydantoinase n=1 Tax=Paenibacillus antibioticophila TaxID=1274374 RepID=A0A919XY45_9BACL|nr:hydantoinase/oxoprolinase family protein [Paenibacillus antibioticophila]GIO38658.1 hydantoinase [Paenibacillus antibioticophila]
MKDSRIRLGIDIGGTFTDLTVYEEESGSIVSLKTPTVSNDPVQGIANGLQLLRERGMTPDQIHYFVHGTTIGLNTLLQRKGAKTALFVTEGFRDILHLQRLRLPVPYDFRSRLPEPLIPRSLTYPISERMRQDGTVSRPLDLDTLDAAIDAAVAAKVEGVVICFLHSYKNAEHELRAAARVKERTGGRMEVTTSSRLWPQMREYERAVMATVNLYILPTCKNYFQTLTDRLTYEGVSAKPFITQSNGGLMDISTAAEAPVRTLFSGPAGGIIGALRAAEAAAISNVITLDMGGTSADISIIENLQPSFVQSNQLSGFPIILPAVSIFSVGAGGGSFAWIDKGGLLKVGPESVGSTPGPACYGQGDKAAMTDAFLLCGYINPDRFAAGSVKLYPHLSEKAMHPIASYLETDVRSAADKMIQVAVANMYSELSGIIEQHGLDPREFSLMGFGGAGPMVANFLAEEIGTTSVLIPPSPGTLCALGSLMADFAYDAVQARYEQLDHIPLPALRKEFHMLAKQAEKWLDEQEINGLQGQTTLYFLDIRYLGQAFELELSITEQQLRRKDHRSIIKAFHELHQRQYGHHDERVALEVIQLRVRILGHTIKPGICRIEKAVSPAEIKGTRSIMCNGRSFKASIYWRSELLEGHEIAGPAIVEQDDTTVLVLDGWNGSVDEYGNLILRRKESE